MATLYLNTKDTELRIDGKALAIYQGGKRLRTVPISLLEQIVISQEVQLSTRVIVSLAEANCGLIMMGGRFKEKLAFVQGTPHNNLVYRVAQIQKLFDPSFCAEWATHIIQVKTKGQLKLLKSALTLRPDLRKSLFTGIQQIENILSKATLKQADVDMIRGQEGALATLYFKAYTSLFPEPLQFTARRRRPPPDPVNACLSLGYTLLYAELTQALYIAGLDPMVGFLHRPAFGRNSLANDLMEPWRYVIERMVWRLFAEQSLRQHNFSVQPNGGCLMGKQGREIFYRTWGQEKIKLTRAIRLQCRSAVKHISEGANHDFFEKSEL